MGHDLQYLINYGTWFITQFKTHSQGEVGQVLDDFGSQSEGAQSAWLWVGLCQTKQGGAEDGRT